MKEFLQPLFWFGIPPLVLTRTDRIFGIISAVSFVLGIIFLFAAGFVKNPVNKKPWKKFGHLGTTVGFLGLFWIVLRYENTPIFSERYWIGLVGVAAIVWLLFALKYLIFNFHPEQVEHQRLEIKNKYLAH